VRDAWTPLVTDRDERARIDAVVGEVAAALDARAATTSCELADVALRRAYLAIDDDGDALARAVAHHVDGGRGIQLFGGITQIGWTVAHLGEGSIVAEIGARIDDQALRALAGDDRTFDLIGGAVGTGVYALERGDAGLPVATRVLTRLEELARPRGGGRAWFTPPELLPDWQRERAPTGYWNLGLAHGTPGVVALLARYVRGGIEATRARALLEEAVTYLTSARNAAGAYPGIENDGDGVGRLAWCYGNLGVAVALLSAASACDRGPWRDEALALARGCAARPFETSGVIDAGLCHGSAGAMHLFHRLFRATGEPAFAEATRRWLDRTLALRSTHAIGGFPAVELDDTGAARCTADPSLLSGAAGVALALRALVDDVEPLWDRLLLLDL
jgi:hypothetical protein